MNLNKKVLTVSIAIILAAPVFQVNAALIDLNISGSADSVAEAMIDSVTDASATNMSAKSSIFGNIAVSIADAQGDDSGWFYSAAYGEYDFTSESIVTQTYNVTNDSSDDQFFDFAFEVMNGSIEAGCNDLGYGGVLESLGNPLDVCTGGDSAEAGYLAQIFVDGSNVWSSQAEVKVDSSGTIFTTSGAVFNNAVSGANFLGWGTSLFNIDLGLVAANASFTLEYSVKTWTTGSFVNITDYQTYGYAQFGDPNGFGSSGNGNQIGSQLTNVSEPNILALLGLGLLGAGFMRKHKKVAN